MSLPLKTPLLYIHDHRYIIYEITTKGSVFDRAVLLKTNDVQLIRNKSSDIAELFDKDKFIIHHGSRADEESVICTPFILTLKGIKNG
jgi:hypothetical protein